MIKVITYGTYDHLHYGHIKLLERAKALGDYLIVGVTAEDYDRTRGKINVQQSLMERIEAIRQTGLADEIIVEEYEGQKIDDIKRYNVDIFTVGSDWTGKFDYLKEYCEVKYLDRTQGISSSEIRTEQSEIRIALVGDSPILNKFVRESKFINGVSITAICTDNLYQLNDEIKSLPIISDSLSSIIEYCDAAYVISKPENHYRDIKTLLINGKHVLCESPIALSLPEYDDLYNLSRTKGLVLMDGIKTAYSTAFNRLILLIKGGVIGDVVSVDATCTSLRSILEDNGACNGSMWNSICFWGPTTLLPVFDILGVEYKDLTIVTKLKNNRECFDLFSKISFVYSHAVASIKVGLGYKSEGELIVSGSKGYVYVPAPWWKTDYFEVRYENASENRRFFYSLEGEGIRYEILSFLREIRTNSHFSYVSRGVSRKIVEVISEFRKGNFISI